MPAVDDVPLASILDLSRALVQVASRAGEDDLAPVAETMARWFDRRGIACRRLAGADGAALGLYAETGTDEGGPYLMLNATLDTAGFGDLATWRHAPISGLVADGWLHGRGSADSKCGAALFAHLLAEFAPLPLRGRLGVLFDLDEHSGGFGGARAFFAAAAGNGAPPRPEIVVIGYPGDDAIVTGSRGFLRARLHIAGVAAHSGAIGARGVNAIERAARLAQALHGRPLPASDALLGLPAQATVVALHGGGPGFSQVPDRAVLALDMRLTAAFDETAARTFVTGLVQRSDAACPAAAATHIEWIPGWPPYRVPDTHPMVQALRDAGRDERGAALPTRVVGPSNIGNWLATLGVPALAGYGVQGEGIHAADERVAIASIAPVFRIFRGALARRLLRR